jgi:hypothetical protein
MCAASACVLLLHVCCFEGVCAAAFLFCRYQPVVELQEPYDPQKEYRSYDCMFPLQQVRFL